MATSQDFVNWVCSDELDYRYLASILVAENASYSLFSRGTTHQTIYFPEVKAFHALLPPLEEQKRIADVIWAINDKIQLNQQINQTLEQMAQAIFKSWFVDFEPVKAKIAALEAGGSAADAERAAMQAISGKDADQLAQMAAEQPEQYAELQTTATLFPAAMQASELGEIPEGWEVAPLPNAIDFLEGPGIRNWQYTNDETGVRFINIRCIQSGDLSLATASRITEEEAYGKYVHFQLKPDDIVISTSGTLGRYAFVRQEHLPLSLNTSVIRFRPIECVSTLHYIAGYVGTQLQWELETRASGSVQRNFGPTHLKQITMLLPNYPLLMRHQSIVDSLFRIRQLRLKEIDTLAELRDTLLPKLLSGELSLPDFEENSAQVAV